MESLRPVGTRALHLRITADKKFLRICAHLRILRLKFLRPLVIRTEKHLDYALGYLALELPKLARAELAQIPLPELASPPVQAVLLELAMMENDWARVVAIAPSLTAAEPAAERPWTAWAFALRELQLVLQARETLLAGATHIREPSALVDYNLACYDCLLGDLASARRRLARAIKRDPNWEADAMSDPDLAALFPKES